MDKGTICEFGNASVVKVDPLQPFPSLYLLQERPLQKLCSTNFMEHVKISRIRFVCYA